MPPLKPHITLTALARIRDKVIPDPSKNRTFLLYCDFYLQKAGRITIPVSKYFYDGDAPPIGSYVFLSGPFWMLTGTDGSIEAENFEVVSGEESLSLNLPSPSVMAIGTVATVIGRDIFMDVGAYSREAKGVVTYQIVVTVPDNPRRGNLRIPQPGSNIGVHGTLVNISVHEEIPAVDLENFTFLPRTDFSRKDGVDTGIRTKRQLISEKGAAVDVGQPMKKTKSGPPEAFTPEELGAGRSSEAGPSQSSAGSSSPPSVNGSLRSTRSATSSQSSVENSPTPEKGSTKATKATKAAKAAT
ncbi:hypothetical protein FRC11_000159 [Ceratobasidium sp. 423]|nr:hypothetical protein FRC11_000159 [Ceratobasidium sp. 423]